MPNHASVAHDHIVTDRGTVANAAVAPDPNRPANQRPRLDHRAFADKHIALDYRLAKRLAKLLRLKIRREIFGDSRHRLPRLAKRPKQSAVLRLTQVKQFVDGRKLGCKLHCAWPRGNKKALPVEGLFVS